MLTYTFSKREKALLLVLALVLIGVAWYQFLFVPTQEQMQQIDSQIAEAQDEITVDAVKAQQIPTMQEEIARYQAEGIEPSVTPAYDNTQALMAELDTKLENAYVYLLEFDDVDTGDGSAGTIASRGLSLGFNCENYEAARDILLSLAHGDYSCSLDQYSIDDYSATTTQTSSTGIVSSNRTSSLNCDVTAHVTFYEQIGSATTGSESDGSSSDESSATQLGNSFGMVNAGRGTGQRVLTEGSAS